MSAGPPLRIGSLVFPGLDQLDLAGPYEVLSRLPGAEYRLYGSTDGPVRDVHGLRLLPDAPLEAAPPLDVLQVPGGPGQEALMADERVLGWLRAQARGARLVFSVCTGALLLGAAGLLDGRRATTHWSAHDLLASFGAEPVDARVVVDPGADGDLVTAAGVTAGLDGALRVVARLADEDTARAVQLEIAYDPDPPFPGGHPATTPPEILDRVTRRGAELYRRRRDTARRYAAGRAPGAVT